MYVEKFVKVIEDLKVINIARRTIKGLNQELTNALRSYDHDNEDEITTYNLVQLDDQVRTKPGIKLPKADSGSELANLFFKSELPTSDINIIEII